MGVAVAFFIVCVVVTVIMAVAARMRLRVRGRVVMRVVALHGGILTGADETIGCAPRTMTTRRAAHNLWADAVNLRRSEL